ncbi:MAG: hypothetical protein AB7S26_09680 [Sandaracinaceae bacterium]
MAKALRMLRALSLSLFALAALRGTAHALRIAIPTPRGAPVLLVSDTPGHDEHLATALRMDGNMVTVVTGDFAQGNAALRADLSQYRLVVWIASGSDYGDAHGDPAVFSNLETYVQNGGRVLVTGYDAIASPTDPLLIQFLGGTDSRDVPSPPGPIVGDANSLTMGLVDIRNTVPTGMAGDRDALTGVLPGTVIVCPSSDDPTQGQWTLRTLGRGEIAWVSNGNASALQHESWIQTAPGPTGVYNAAVRNFAYAALRGPPIAVVQPPPVDDPPVEPPTPPPVGQEPPPPLAPPGAPLRFNADDRAGPGWAISAHALAAHTLEEQRWFVGGSLSAMLTLSLDMDGADEHRHGALNGLLGDSFGLALRGHFFGRVDRGADASYAVAIGGQLVLVNALGGGDVRIPSLAGLVSPEVGVMIRSDRDPSFYFAWHAPFALLLESWFSLEARVSIFLIEDWRTVQGTEAMVAISIGAAIR